MEKQTQSLHSGLEQNLQSNLDCEPLYPGVEKFMGQVVMVTGGQSGIGRAIALAFANEGASICILYKDEDLDAEKTKRMVQDLGSQCILIRGDMSTKNFCAKAVTKTIEEFDRLDVLVTDNSEDLLFKEALPYIKEKKGSLLFHISADYYVFINTLAKDLAAEGVRVNGVAPGSITAFQATFLNRPGRPNEVAGCFTFLASKEASYMTGQLLHPNGGITVNS